MQKSLNMLFDEICIKARLKASDHESKDTFFYIIIKYYNCNFNKFKWNVIIILAIVMS